MLMNNFPKSLIKKKNSKTRVGHIDICRRDHTFHGFSLLMEAIDIKEAKEKELQLKKLEDAKTNAYDTIFQWNKSADERGDLSEKPVKFQEVEFYSPTAKLDEDVLILAKTEEHILKLTAIDEEFKAANVMMKVALVTEEKTEDKTIIYKKIREKCLVPTSDSRYEKNEDGVLHILSTSCVGFRFRAAAIKSTQSPYRLHVQMVDPDSDVLLGVPFLSDPFFLAAQSKENSATKDLKPLIDEKIPFPPYTTSDPSVKAEKKAMMERERILKEKSWATHCKTASASWHARYP